MKTAISLQDTLMAQADDAARELGMSRSGLIAEALREYLQRRRRAQITKRLNEAYADQPSAAEQGAGKKLLKKLPAQDKW